MKVDHIHSQGSAGISEDGLILNYPNIFGVTDGVSGLYLPQNGPRLFHGMSGGQLASWHIVSAFGYPHSLQLKLEQFLESANSALGNELSRNGMNRADSAHLPGACFLVIKIDGSKVEIIQGGDCMATWEHRDGRLGGLAHQSFQYEDFLLKTIARLMKKYNGNKQRMWEEFQPILERHRQRFVNASDGICILNGQPSSNTFWRKASLKLASLKTLIVFSDGFVPFEWTKDSKELARNIIGLYNMLNQSCLFPIDKLTRILLQTRTTSRKAETHEDYPEATAIAIEF